MPRYMVRVRSFFHGRRSFKFRINCDYCDRESVAIAKIESHVGLKVQEIDWHLSFWHIRFSEELDPNYDAATFVIGELP